MREEAFIILMFFSVLIFMGNVLYRLIAKPYIFLDLDLWVTMGGMLFTALLAYFGVKNFLQGKEFLSRLTYGVIGVLFGVSVGLMLAKTIYTLERFLPLAFGFALRMALLLIFTLIKIVRGKGGLFT